MSDKHSASLLYELAQTLLRNDAALKAKVSHIIIKHLIDTGDAATAGVLYESTPADIQTAILQQHEKASI